MLLVASVHFSLLRTKKRHNSVLQPFFVACLVFFLFVTKSEKKNTVYCYRRQKTFSCELTKQTLRSASLKRSVSNFAFVDKDDESDDDDNDDDDD
jgi:hypothetical protein